jgi:hypothetical protein
MECEIVQRLLDEVAEGKRPEHEADPLWEHVRSCPDCRAEYDAGERFLKSLQSLPPYLLVEDRGPAEGPHLRDAELWELVQAPGSRVTPQDRERWKHVLHCATCYAGAAALREVAVDPSFRTPDPSADRVLRKVQAMVLVIAVCWTNKKLEVRTPAAARRNGTRGGGEPWTVEHAFGDYQVLFEIVPRETRETCDVRLVIKSTPPGVSRQEVSGSLYKDEGLIAGSFTHPGIRFSGLGPGVYSLRLSREVLPQRKPEIIAAVSLPINRSEDAG